ncbi:hypothetical protein [Azospirillum aestuarii]|uniref:hypothetical protein n=1 Tax=Azospirillum aestuarii TaxID=2802052 RepID=UPI004054BA04
MMQHVYVQVGPVGSPLVQIAIKLGPKVDKTAKSLESIPDDEDAIMPLLVELGKFAMALLDHQATQSEVARKALRGDAQGLAIKAGLALIRYGKNRHPGHSMVMFVTPVPNEPRAFNGVGIVAYPTAPEPTCKVTLGFDDNDDRVIH